MADLTINDRNLFVTRTRWLEKEYIHRIPDITDVGPTDFNTTLAADDLNKSKITEK